jgi:hypothetical protein
MAIQSMADPPLEEGVTAARPIIAMALRAASIQIRTDRKKRTTGEGSTHKTLTNSSNNK